MTLNAEIRRQVKRLGGTMGPETLGLEDALRSIQLPPMVQDNGDNIEEARAATDTALAREVLARHSTTDEDLLAVLPSSIPVTSVRTFDGNYFRPFSDEWRDLVAPEPYVREIVRGDEMVFLQFAFVEGGFPDLAYICLSDPDPTNPTIYTTDHAQTFKEDCIDDAGPLASWLAGFFTLRQTLQVVADEAPA